MNKSLGWALVAVVVGSLGAAGRGSPVIRAAGAEDDARETRRGGEDGELCRVQLAWTEAFVRATRPEPPPFVEQVKGARGEELARSLFAGITLPGHPGQAEAREYVVAILARVPPSLPTKPASPIVSGYLARVGTDHVDTLSDALLSDLWGGHRYVLGAIKQLSTEKHRASLARRVRYAEDLVEVFLERGWTTDVAAVLTERLAQRRLPLSFDWIVAAAPFALKSERGREDLLFHIRESGNGYNLWAKLHEQRVLDLPSDWVRQTWESVRSDSAARGDARIKWAELTQLAAAHGVKEALDEMARVTSKEDGVTEMLSVFSELTGYPMRDGAAGVARWYAERRERLRFNPETEKYEAGSAGPGR